MRSAVQRVFSFAFPAMHVDVLGWGSQSEGASSCCRAAHFQQRRLVVPRYQCSKAANAVSTMPGELSAFSFMSGFFIRQRGFSLFDGTLTHSFRFRQSNQQAATSVSGSGRPLSSPITGIVAILMLALSATMSVMTWEIQRTFFSLFQEAFLLSW